jgi:predicted metal-dependent hydrolase
MDITYTVNKSRKRKRTISLRLRNEKEVVVCAPWSMSAAAIDRFIREKQDWIHKAIKKHRENALKTKAREYDTGEHFPYLGQSYPLEVFFEPCENAGIVLWDNRFYLNTREDRNLRKNYFVSWYKKKALEHIRGRVDFFSRELEVRQENIKITAAQRRWGSCSQDNNLTFSYRLIMAPPDVIDYVVVHELAHIREKNHSPKFWKRVEEVMPEYRTHRRWLRENSHKFIL